MMNRRNRGLLIGLTASGLLVSAAAQAEMTGAGDTPPPGSPAPDGMQMENDGSLDAERERLFETARRDDQAALEAAEAMLADAERSLQEAIDAGAEPAVIESLETERDAALGAVEHERAEPEALRAALLEMSDEQVEATNRALRNANSNRTITDLDAATLQDIAARDLNRREIQSLTKALEEDAKFQKHGDRFEAKYEQTGKKQFLEKRDRAIERGERQRDKFEAKVDRSVERRSETRAEMRNELRSETKREARDGVRSEAKAEAKRTARDEARREKRGNGRGRN